MLNKTIATELTYRTELHHITQKNADGSPVRCRVNGKCKVWKTRPEDYRLPVKHGLRDCFYITPANEHEWNLPDSERNRPLHHVVVFVEEDGSNQRTIGVFNTWEQALDLLKALTNCSFTVHTTKDPPPRKDWPMLEPNGTPLVAVWCPGNAEWAEWEGESLSIWHGPKLNNPWIQ